LFIGDDGQHLERGARQPGGALQVQEALDILGELRGGGELDGALVPLQPEAASGAGLVEGLQSVFDFAR
jgi:hypothetical protein